MQRSIFARFPEQLLKDLVSCGSPGECSMIDRFLGDAFEVLSCQFWSTVLQSGARLPIHTLIKLVDRTVSGPRFLTVGVFECDTAHRRSLAVLCMLYKIRCNLVALSKLLIRGGKAGAECAILPYVGHLQLISTLKMGADCCQLCQYKLTKPNLT